MRPPHCLGLENRKIAEVGIGSFASQTRMAGACQELPKIGRSIGERASVGWLRLGVSNPPFVTPGSV